MKCTVLHAEMGFMTMQKRLFRMPEYLLLGFSMKFFRPERGFFAILLFLE